MATATYTGAVYGIGVYGVAVYGLSNVSILVDGVQGTCTTDSGVIITADANHVVIGVTSAGAVGQVGTIGKALVLPTGVEGTVDVGTAVATAAANTLADSVAATGSIGTTDVTGTSLFTLASTPLIGTIGVAEAQASALATVTGNSASVSTNNVDVFENEVVIPLGLQAESNVGSVAISVTLFDYTAVADQYDRRRTVYVERKTTSKDRTVNVPKSDRVVYVEAKTTARTVYVPYESRIVYIDRRTTSADRTKLAA